MPLSSVSSYAESDVEKEKQTEVISYNWAIEKQNKRRFFDDGTKSFFW